MISEALRTQSAMLASPSTKYGADAEKVMQFIHATGKFTFDVKLDGVRCLAYIEDGKAWLRNRNDVNISHRYPEIVAALEKMFPKGDWVLDGEMLCFGTDGLPTFKLIATRDAQSNPAKIAALAAQTPATFVAFDLLCHSGSDIRKLPLMARLKLMDTTFQGLPLSARIQRTATSTDGQRMWDFTIHNKMEGLVAKDITGQYHGRRDAGWIKLKSVKHISALVTGVQPGEGSRAGKIGALLLSLFNDTGELVDLGKCGTGFKDRDLVALDTAIREASARNELVIVEIEYQEATPDGKLRFPSWRGIRSDITAADCTTAQLTQ